jgi:hypothetical protein
MSREVGQVDATTEAYLALARLRAGNATDTAEIAERLSGYGDDAALAVAELWRELGERDRAVAHAMRAHHWAVADGEPYVLRWELNRARKLLTELGVPLPDIPTFDPSTLEPFPWEADLDKWLEEKKAEKAEEDRQRTDAGQV